MKITPPSASVTLSTVDAIDRARRGDVEPLLVRIVDGSATVTERKFVAEGFREFYKSDLRPRGKADKEARDRKIAARMVELCGLPKAVVDVAKEFGVSPRTVWSVLKKCGGVLITP
jgi:hypothetical protein